MKDWAVVGPTNAKPRRLSSRAMSVDSAVFGCRSASVVGTGRDSGSEGRSATPARVRLSPSSRSRRMASRIAIRRLDLGAVAHDRGVAEQCASTGARRSRRPGRSRSRRNARRRKASRLRRMSAMTAPTGTPPGSGARMSARHRGAAAPLAVVVGEVLGRPPRHHQQRIRPSGPGPTSIAIAQRGT